MRPLVSSVQRIPRALVHFAYPRSRLGLAARHVADKLITTALLRVVVKRLHSRDRTTRALPAWNGS